jgi:hypothetical protein
LSAKNAVRFAVCGQAPVSRKSGPVPGTCFACPHSSWSPPLAPPAPQRSHPPCSSASQLLWRCRTLTAVCHRLRLLAFPMQTSAVPTVPLASRETSRFPRKERPHMPVSTTAPGRPSARDVAPVRMAFRHRNDVSTREDGSFAAQWLACALPVNASLRPSRATAHDSGSMRFATPSS